jgi:hypothetical protein
MSLGGFLPHKRKQPRLFGLGCRPSDAIAAGVYKQVVLSVIIVNSSKYLESTRVITYIDGFNLYFGLKSQNWERYLWLDVQALSKNLLRPDQTLAHTKYFTARISAPPDKVKRQNTYLDAIGTLQNTTVRFGHYLNAPRSCRNCGYVYNAPQEKMTDVSIAVELLEDAFKDAFDTALLMTPTPACSACASRLIDTP